MFGDAKKQKWIRTKHREDSRKKRCGTIGQLRAGYDFISCVSMPKETRLIPKVSESSDSHCQSKTQNND